MIILMILERWSQKDETQSQPNCTKSTSSALPVSSTDSLHEYTTIQLTLRLMQNHPNLVLTSKIWMCQYYFCLQIRTDATHENILSIAGFICFVQRCKQLYGHIHLYISAIPIHSYIPYHTIGETQTLHDIASLQIIGKSLTIKTCGDLVMVFNNSSPKSQ